MITTVGPRKPQRTSAGGFTNNAIEPEYQYQIDSESCRLLSTFPCHSPKTTTPAHRIQLETSFTSLISPNDKSNCKISLQSFCSQSSSNNTTNNTITTNSILKNDSRILLKDMKTDVNYPSAKIIIPWEYQSMLDDQNFDRLGKSRNEIEYGKVDLLHDDWFGLAPLATPESLSEVSSISSRASSVIIHHERVNSLQKDRWIHSSSLSHKKKYANGFKRNVCESQERTVRNPLGTKCKNFENSDSSDSYLDSPPLNRGNAHLKTIQSIDDSRKSSSGESNFLNYGICSPERNVHQTSHINVQRSPRMLRRTLKITKDLSTAYEDFNSNKRFEEMMKLRFDRYDSTSTTENETNSYTSAKSQELEKSSTDLYMTPMSSCGDSSKLRSYSTPEKVLDDAIFYDANNEKDSGRGKSLHDVEGEDINYHKPTVVIFPTDENFPSLFSDRNASQLRYPYFETDFSLSDPDLTVCKTLKEKNRRIHFDENIESESRLSIQDYEFDVETRESVRLIDSTTTCNTTMAKNDVISKDRSGIYDDDGDGGDNDETKSSQDLLKVNDSKNLSVYNSKSAEALPLLANIGQPEKKRKYSFSFLAINKGESIV